MRLGGGTTTSIGSSSSSRGRLSRISGDEVDCPLFEEMEIDGVDVAVADDSEDDDSGFFVKAKDSFFEYSTRQSTRPKIFRSIASFAARAVESVRGAMVKTGVRVREIERATGEWDRAKSLRLTFVRITQGDDPPPACGLAAL